MRTFITIIFYSMAFAFWQTQASAGLLIMSSETILGGSVPVTNSIVIKVDTNCVRMDFGWVDSVISYADKPMAIQLFHASKTYLWQPVNSPSVPNSTGQSTSDPGVGAVFDGYPATLHVYTNGPLQFTRIWVAPATQFIKTNTTNWAMPTRNMSGTFLVGSLFDASNLVVGSESSIVSPPPVAGGGGANTPTGQPNKPVFTRFSKLISITATNFAAAEFDLPKDYTEAMGIPAPVMAFDPTRYGFKTNSLGNLERVRRESAKGIPILAWPPAPSLGK